MKNVIIFVLLYICLLCSCSQQTNTEVEAGPFPQESLDDSTEIVDNHKLATYRLTAIDSFLLEPFDLYNFKKIKGSSNSGFRHGKSYQHQPSKKGIYYDFFFFSGMIGYIGFEKANLVRNEDGLTITTFKPEGPHQQLYDDPNEILIEVKARLNDPGLPELAFVGLDTTVIQNQLGPKNFEFSNCWIYTYKERALILRIEKGKVEWLRYIHMMEELTEGHLPKDIFKE